MIRTAESVTFTCCPALATRAIGIDAQILFVDVYLDVFVNLGENEERREGGVPSFRRIERRDSHEAVDAHLRAQIAVCVWTCDRESGTFEPSLFPFLVVDHLGFETAALRPAQIHAQQHLRPVLRFGAARTRVDADDGVRGVVLSAEELLKLGGFRLPPATRRDVR